MSAIFGSIASWAINLIGGSALSFLTPFLSAGASVIGFAVNFVMGILLDLSKTYEGRIFLAAVFLSLAGWYVESHYTYVARAYLTGIEEDIDRLDAANKKLVADNGALGKRPASCPKTGR